MDDPLAAPTVDPPPPTQFTPPPAMQPAPEVQQPKPHAQSNKALLIIPIVVIIIIVAGGAFLLMNKNSPVTPASNSTVPTTVLSSVSTSIASHSVASTSISTPNNGAPCPCLTEQQLEQILNVSAAERQTGVFNQIVALNSAAVMELMSNNSEANKTASLPEGILSNVTEAWAVTYNASTNHTGIVAAEVVLKSSDINGFITYLNSQLNSSVAPVSESTVNGFHYVYADLAFFGENIIVIEGYKDNYIIGFGLGASTNTIIAPESTIVSEISGAA